MTQFWWIIYPYLALATMIIGSVYRYAHNPMSWGSRSSELLEKRWLKWGSQLFHWGILLVIVGHVMGLLVPLSAYQAMGISAHLYHENADILGAIAGLMTWAGLAILLLRRFGNVRVRRNSSVSDIVALSLLFIVVTTGDYLTIIRNNVMGPYEYRASVGPWVRGLFVLHPNAALMTHVPVAFQVHIILAFLLFAISPFTRLVHIWSLPLAHLRRAPIQYRDREQYRSYLL
ncbi:respiratory nitrate reductase subunit gamma [Sulfobacillus harzensis]|uniref:Respiratory nitrate reductase subunit gamma n=1 Tax=Sulfobacillus harzensis TaxID=2729629 RepID=A0A7Y0L671_9FIRM|nr:respiratory nitrate reductase subunit gamma [Sulfobacillus harzensis]NMP23976.1 respiratory nitrate reductase subunit gamma [Sulfobacillus harzensis]